MPIQMRKSIALLFISLLPSLTFAAGSAEANLLLSAENGLEFSTIVLVIVSVCVLILGIYLGGQFALSLRGGQGGQGTSKLGTLGGAIAAIAFGSGLLFNTIQADFLGNSGGTNVIKKVQLGYNHQPVPFDSENIELTS